MKTTDAGYINKNNQKNLGYRGVSKTHISAKSYEMECLDCGHKYLANGCDVWERKCPKCQDIPILQEEQTAAKSSTYDMISNSNSENPKIGREFQERVKKWFEMSKEMPFELEHPILIGYPAKLHKFDIADKAEKMVIECKSYTYTSTGNIPSAKLTTLNEAIFYFSFLPTVTEKVLVMAYATHPKRKETLAEYYVRINGHLLGQVNVWEYNTNTGEMRMIKND